MTLTERRAEAQRLATEEKLSRRQIAVQLGVGKTTVDSDLRATGASTQIRHPKVAYTDAQRQDILATVALIRTTSPTATLQSIAAAVGVKYSTVHKWLNDPPKEPAPPAPQPQELPEPSACRPRQHQRLAIEKRTPSHHHRLPTSYSGW